MLQINSAKVMNEVSKEKRSEFLERCISEAANAVGFEVTLPTYQINRKDIGILRELGYKCNFNVDTITIGWENV